MIEDDADESIGPAGAANGDMIRALIDSAPDALILVAEDGHIEFLNPAAEAMFSFDRDELVGKPVEVLLPGRLHSVHREHRFRFRASPEARPMGTGSDLVARRADGSEIPVEISLSPVTVAGRRYVIAGVRNVSRRQAAEAALKAEEARFRATFHEGPVPMLIGDVTGDTRMIIDANRAALELLGRSRKEILGRSAAGFVHPDDADQGTALVRALKSDRYKDFTCRVRVFRPDGDTVWVQLHVSPLALEGGRSLAVLHVLDVTAEVRAETIQARNAALHGAVSRVRLASLRGASRSEGLTMICRAATDVLDAEAATVYTGVGELAMEAAVGMTEELTAAVEKLRSRGFVDELSRTEDIVSIGGDDPLIADHNRRPTEAEPIDSIVLAPLTGSGGVVGFLAVVRRPGPDWLDAHDRQGVSLLAREAVISIELAEQRAIRQRLELLDDRERIARDMHDMVISRLFATGMKLQAGLHAGDEVSLRTRIEEAVEQIDKAITEIRSTIFGLRSVEGRSQVLRDMILDVVDEHASGLGFEPVVRFDGPVDDVPEHVADALAAVLREALTNVSKHARAQHVSVDVSVADDMVTMTAEDDGIGFRPDPHAKGRGLGNMAARAEPIAGRLDIVSTEGVGTVVTLSCLLSGPTRR